MATIWGEGNSSLLEAAMRSRQEDQMSQDLSELPPENEAGNPRLIWSADRRDVLRREREAREREEAEANLLRAQRDLFKVG